MDHQQIEELRTEFEKWANERASYLTCAWYKAINPCAKYHGRYILATVDSAWQAFLHGMSSRNSAESSSHE